jgi:hypothetical protein
LVVGGWWWVVGGGWLVVGGWWVDRVIIGNTQAPSFDLELAWVCQNEESDAFTFIQVYLIHFCIILILNFGFLLAQTQE